MTPGAGMSELRAALDDLMRCLNNPTPISGDLAASMLRARSLLASPDTAPSEEGLRGPITAYLCGDERDGLVCALYSGHPNDRGPGHVWVSVAQLIEAGTVAWHPARPAPLDAPTGHTSEDDVDVADPWADRQGTPAGGHIDPERLARALQAASFGTAYSDRQGRLVEWRYLNELERANKLADARAITDAYNAEPST